MIVSDVIALLRFAQEVYLMENAWIWLTLLAIAGICLCVIPTVLSCLSYIDKKRHLQKVERATVVSQRIEMLSCLFCGAAVGLMIYHLARPSGATALIRQMRDA